MAAKTKINDHGDVVFTEQDAIDLLYTNPEFDVSKLFFEDITQYQSALKELGLELEPNSIMSYVKLCMEIVEKTDVKGKEQKTLVIQLITKLVKDAPISDEREKLCLDVLSSGIVGDTIDLIVMASRGQLDLNSVSQTAIKRAPALISLFTKCCKSKKK